MKNNRKASMNIEEKLNKIMGNTESLFKSMEEAKLQTQPQNSSSSDEELDSGTWDKNLKEIHKYVENKKEYLRSEAYYWTMKGKIKGMLSIKRGIIIFDPLEWQENEHFEDLSKFNWYLDLQDIVDVQMIKIPNESAIYLKNEKTREWYIYDHYIQFALSTVQGKNLDELLVKRADPNFKDFRSQSCKIVPEIDFTEGLSNSSPREVTGVGMEKKTSKCDYEPDKSKKQPKALVFFRFSHRNETGEALTNKQQEAIVDNIYQNIFYLRKNLEPSKNSSTKVPFYDSLIDEDQNIIPYSEISSKEKVTQFSEDHKEDPSKSGDADIMEEALKVTKKVVSLSIPTFSPFGQESKSSIISETQAILVSRYLPPIIRMREWERLFCTEVDGLSFKTFYNNLKSHTATILVIQDSKGWKFGWYSASDWEIQKYFYGTGESFLFTFKDTDEDISVHKWTGINDNIQYSSKDSIAMGGDLGKHGLYIRNYFSSGSSNKWSTFNNETLSSEEFFDIVKFEVWGFDWY